MKRSTENVDMGFSEINGLWSRQNRSVALG